MSHIIWLNLRKWARLWPWVNHQHGHVEGLQRCMFHLPYIFRFRTHNQHIQSNLKTCPSISSETILEWSLEIWLRQGIEGFELSANEAHNMTHILWVISYSDSYEDLKEIPNLILILVFTKLSPSNVVATCLWITWPDCFLNPFFWNQIHGKIPVVLFYFQRSSMYHELWRLCLVKFWLPTPKWLKVKKDHSWSRLVNYKFKISIRFGTLVNDITHFEI